jgi:hypothetical protein
MFGQNPLKDVDSRVFTRMLRTEGRTVALLYIPSQLCWRGDKNSLRARKPKGLKVLNMIVKIGKSQLCPSEVKIILICKTVIYGLSMLAGNVFFFLLNSFISSLNTDKFRYFSIKCDFIIHM